MAAKKGFVRLGQGDLPQKYQVYRGAPPVRSAAPAAPPAAKDPNPELLKEKKALQDKLAAAAKQIDTLSAELEEAKSAEPVVERVEFDSIMVHKVDKVRKVDDDHSKVVCDFSVGEDEEVISGEIIVPNSAARHLKRIGAKK